MGKGTVSVCGGVCAEVCFEIDWLGRERVVVGGVDAGYLG